MIESVLPLLGIALCTIALLQLVLWSAHSLTQWSHEKKQFQISREVLRQQIAAVSVNRPDSDSISGNWNGYREFVVNRLVQETKLGTSVYLKPSDGKPIAGYRPGQHLTFKLEIPGESKPVVRCYSLSAAPSADCYRITVKKMLPPDSAPGANSGRVSSFIHQSLMVGDRVQAKAPSGHFVLDESSTAPAVFLAGGVGITPVFSMLDHIAQSESQRAMILVYGCRNSEDHIFKDHLTQLSHRHSNIHIVTVYSEPRPQDQEGVDYHRAGFISIEFLQKILPNNHCQFYLCGPPPFMVALYKGLITWQVPESRIFYEAFGPSSINHANAEVDEKDAAISSAHVEFTASNQSVVWSNQHQSLLELAEASGIEMESGCRAGSCGACQTLLLAGKIKYPEGMPVDCEPGYCLTCIAQPDGDVGLDA